MRGSEIGRSGSNGNLVYMINPDLRRVSRRTYQVSLLRTRYILLLVDNKTLRYDEYQNK